MESDLINVLALAYLGDSIYEVYIRKYLLDKGISKVNELQKEAIKYVSAKGQAMFLQKLMDEEELTEEEMSVVRRARNHKSHPSKTTDIRTYKNSTGLEALIGYLYINKKMSRVNEIMSKIIKMGK